jgi:hypothetical protein
MLVSELHDDVRCKHGIPVLCLYRPVPGRRLSAMIAGASGVEVVAYEHLSEAKLAISRFLQPMM